MARISVIKYLGTLEMKKLILTIFFLLVGIPAFAATVNLYSNGNVRPEWRVANDSSATWLTTRNAANSTFGNSWSFTDNFYVSDSVSQRCAPSACTVRFMVYFDASSIPAGSTITAASLSFWANATASTSDNTAFVEVTKSNFQGTVTGTTDNSFPQAAQGVGAGSPPAALEIDSEHILLTNIAGSATTTLNLNANGLALIQIGNGATTTKLTLVIGPFDASSTVPAFDGQSLVTLSTSKNNTPLVLAVTYTPASSGATNNDEQNWWLILMAVPQSFYFKKIYG